MNKKNTHLCKVGTCRHIEIDFLAKDKDLKNYGVCCTDCVKKDTCKSVCRILKFKKLEVEECEDRTLYSTLLKEVTEDKRKKLIELKKEVEVLEYEISTMEDKLSMKSPLNCKNCGGYVEYDTKTVLISRPPKFSGKCTSCNETQYIPMDTFYVNKENYLKK